MLTEETIWIGFISAEINRSEAMILRESICCCCRVVNEAQCRQERVIDTLGRIKGNGGSDWIGLIDFGGIKSKGN